MTIFVVLTVLAITQPYVFHVGSFQFAPYRLVLFVGAIPLFLTWVRGRAGGILLPDILILLFVIWLAVGFTVGGQAHRVFEYFGAQLIDVFVAYLLGRVAIRSRDDFLHLCKVFLCVLLVVLPFAAFEAFTGKSSIHFLFNSIPGLDVHEHKAYKHAPRFGLSRAQVSLEHPIHFGLIAAMGFALPILGLKAATGAWRQPIVRMALLAGTTGCVFFSLSAGAFVSLLVQAALIAYHRIARLVPFKWWSLIGGGAVAYGIMALIANRPPILILAQTIALNAQTAYMRVHVWNFGFAEALKNPIFGIPGSDWERPDWMHSGSVDNYWLSVAMFGGFPALLLVSSAFLVLLLRISRTKNLSFEDEQIRLAYFFVVIGTFVSLGTVTIWEILQMFVFFFVGAGAWLISAGEVTGENRGTSTRKDSEKDDGDLEVSAISGQGSRRYSRFPRRDLSGVGAPTPRGDRLS